MGTRLTYTKTSLNERSQVCKLLQFQELQQSQEQSDWAWGDDLGLFYSGLFNFYEIAEITEKEKFLNFIEDQVLKLKRELLLSLPGFILCMLSALDYNNPNGKMITQVERILGASETIVGTSTFFGELWKCILRSQKCRLSAIQYIQNKLPPNQQIAQELLKSEKISVSVSPFRMMINDGKLAIEVGNQVMPPKWQDNEIQLLDELKSSASQYAYFYFYYPHKEELVNNAILAALSTEKNQSYLINEKILEFMISHMPISNKLNTEQEFVNLMESGLLIIQKQNYRLRYQNFFKWFFEHREDQEPGNDDPKIKFVCPALKTIFTKFYNLSNEIERQNDDDEEREVLFTQCTPILIVKNLLNENLKTIARPILEEISVDLIKFIQHYYKPESDEEIDQEFSDLFEQLFKMITDYTDCVFSALKNLLLKEIECKCESMESISLIKFCLKDIKHMMNMRDQMITPILEGLLSGMNQDSTGFALPALQLINEILGILSDDPIDLDTSVWQFNDFYQKLQDGEHVVGENAILKKSSEVLYKIQRYASLASYKEKAEKCPWFSSLKKNACSVASGIQVQLISTDAFLNILVHSREDKYKVLKELFVHTYDLGQIKKSEQEDDCTEIIKTLWSLLDKPAEHERIVQSLKRFDKEEPAIFSEVITEDINNKDHQKQYKAVTKFSIFWKITAKDHDYKPFEQATFEKATQKDRKFYALHKMLEILEDRDPTMRITCRSWLSESKRDFQRILDPLLIELVHPKLLNDQCFFMKDYDATRVVENFSKLRNILLNTQNELIEFINKTKTSKYFNDSREQTEISNYIEAIVEITLKFIMGQADEGLSLSVKQETHTVNASAVEFMELILKSLQNYKDQARKIAHQIIGPVVQMLRSSIESNNVVQQVHLLNLLKVIIFECSFNRKSSNVKPEIVKKNKEDLFEKKFFMECIRDGMKNESSFVRNAFIQFSEVVLPFIQGIIRPEEFKGHVTIMLKCYCSLLRQSNVDLKQHKLINQETDVIAVIKGLETLLNLSLGIKIAKPVEEDKLNSQKAVREESLTMNWFPWTNQAIMSSDPLELLKKEIWNRENTQDLMLSCIAIWNGLDLLKVRDYYFTRLGNFPYNKVDEESMQLRCKDVNLSEFLEQGLNNIQHTVIKMLQPISKDFLQQLIDGLIKIWVELKNEDWTEADMQVSQGCDRIIQILVSLEVQPHHVIEAINRWILNNQDQESKTSVLNATNKRTAIQQSRTCQFVYYFFVQTIRSHFKDSSYSDQISQLKKHTAQFIRNFSESKHPTTILWLLEVMLVVSTKFRLDDSKLELKSKSEFQALLNSLLTSSAAIITDQFKVTYNSDYGFDQLAFNPTIYEMLKRYEFVKQKAKKDGQSIEHLRFDAKSLEQIEEIPFQNDSIFKNFKQVRYVKKQQSNNNALSVFLLDLNKSLHDRSLPKYTQPLQQQEVFKYFTLQTLRQILFRLTEILFEKGQSGYSLQIVVDAVMSILQLQLRKVNVENDEFQKKKNQVQSEGFSDFLAGLTHESKYLQNQKNREIAEIFNSENFFLQSKLTIRNWKEIMRSFMSTEVGGMMFRNLLISQKSSTLKRLGFLVYSSDDSPTSGMLEQLLEKMREGFKNAYKDSEMSHQLFLLARILMVKLDPEDLEIAMRKLWPHLLNELVDAFHAKEPDHSLQTEGIKIVELMSQLNILYFQMNQWMFLFDGYGLQAAQNQTDDAQTAKPVFQPYLAQFTTSLTSRSPQATYVSQMGPVEISKSEIPSLNQTRQTAYEAPSNTDALKDCTSGYASRLQKCLAKQNVKQSEKDRKDARFLIDKDFQDRQGNQ